MVSKTVSSQCIVMQNFVVSKPVCVTKLFVSGSICAVFKTSVIFFSFLMSFSDFVFSSLLCCIPTPFISVLVMSVTAMPKGTWIFHTSPPE